MDHQLTNTQFYSGLVVMTTIFSVHMIPNMQKEANVLNSIKKNKSEKVKNLNP